MIFVAQNLKERRRRRRETDVSSLQLCNIVLHLIKLYYTFPKSLCLSLSLSNVCARAAEAWHDIAFLLCNLVVSLVTRSLAGRQLCLIQWQARWAGMGGRRPNIREGDMRKKYIANEWKKGRKERSSNFVSSFETYIRTVFTYIKASRK